MNARHTMLIHLLSAHSQFLVDNDNAESQKFLSNGMMKKKKYEEYDEEYVREAGGERNLATRFCINQAFWAEMTARMCIRSSVKCGNDFILHETKSSSQVEFVFLLLMLFFSCSIQDTPPSGCLFST